MNICEFYIVANISSWFCYFQSFFLDWEVSLQRKSVKRCGVSTFHSLILKYQEPVDVDYKYRLNYTLGLIIRYFTNKNLINFF